jgi:hypothetical protein
MPLARCAAAPAATYFFWPYFFTRRLFATADTLATAAVCKQHSSVHVRMVLHNMVQSSLHSSSRLS